jgi:hypothetical protein
MSCFAQTQGPIGRILSTGGAQTVGRSMTKAEQFREYAEEALRWSSRSRTAEEKKALIDLAVTWTQAASWSERKSVDPLRA